MAVEAPEATSPPPLPFNFSRAGLIAGDQMRALRALDEQFSRNLTHTLGAWLRSNVTVAPLPAEQQIFSEFAESTGTGCHVLPLRIRMEDQHTRGVLSMSLSLAPAAIDLLLGGSGRSSGPLRDLTEIEEAVLDSVTDLILRERTAAWAPFGLEFHAGIRERDGHGQRLMSLHERVFCCRFQMTLADITGELIFCLPSTALIATLRLTSHRRERQRQRTHEERSRMAARLHGAGVHATLCFPQMRLSARELRTLAPGTLLQLPLLRSVGAEVLVDGVAVFRAEAVRAGEHRAARLSQPLEASREGGKP